MSELSDQLRGWANNTVAIGGASLAEEAADMLDAIDAPHADDGWGYCPACGYACPCPTLRLIHRMEAL